MTRAAVVLGLVVALGAIQGGQAQAQGDSMAEVIGLLNTLKANAQSSKDADEELYVGLKQHCDDQKQELRRLIKKNHADIQGEDTKITATQANMDSLTKTIAKLSDDISTRTTQLAAAQLLAQDTEETLAKRVQELNDTLGTIDTILGNMENSSGHMQSVIDELNKLKTKFTQDKNFLEGNQGNNANADALNTSAQQDAINALNGSKEAAETSLGSETAANGVAKSDKAGFETDLEDNQTELRDTVTACTKKAEEWEERSNSYTQEINAIEEAITALQNTGQSDAPRMEFVQVRSHKPLPSLEEAAKRLQATGDSHLAAIATQMTDKALKANKQICVKILGMMTDLEIRLKNDQMEENKNNDWCQKEAKLTKMSIMENFSQKFEARSKMISLTAMKTTLEGELDQANIKIGEAQDEIARLKEEHRLEKIDNKKWKDESEQGLRAVKRALTSLRRYYSNVPKPQEAAATVDGQPATWSGNYQGQSMGAEVLSALENLEARYTTSMAEAQNTAETDEMDFNTARQHQEQKEAKQKATATALEQRIAGKKENFMSRDNARRAVNKEILANLNYWKQLNKRCTGEDMHEDITSDEVLHTENAEDVSNLETKFDTEAERFITDMTQARNRRTAARDSEIASIQSAYETLDAYCKGN